MADHAHHYDRLVPSQSTKVVRDIDSLGNGVLGQNVDNWQNTFHLVDATTPSGSLTDNVSADNQQPLGKPAKKKTIHALDIVVSAVSITSLVVAVLVVANENISWRLGIANNQLITVGFLLSIMSICLNSVAPLFFVLLEARFGGSNIQNYDAILRNRPLASRLSNIWRVILGLMLALPIALSVAYKTFAGGQSTLKVNGTDYISIPAYYGMFVPPGLTSISGKRSVAGLSLFFNATLPFREASYQLGSYESEPPLPTFPQPYGYNVLLLNATSTAILDTLDPEYIISIQKLIAIGESWKISASVLGTVSTLDSLRIENEADFNSSYQLACDEASKTDGSWVTNSYSLFNSWSFSLMNQKGLSDQSTQYIGVAPVGLVCAEIMPYIYRFRIYRQPCEGTWSVTRGGFQLLRGFCYDTILPPIKQKMITYNDLRLPQWYMGPLMETLGVFSGGSRGIGNQSVWMIPSMATSVATMMWSRVTLMQSTEIFSPENFNMSQDRWTLEDNTKATYHDIDILYPVAQTDQTILYTRPTLRRSYWLYLALAVQPAIVVVFLGLTFTLHSTPLSKGFGLVSILSGIDRQSLDNLAGASLSGELVQPVKLLISPIQEGKDGVIRYQVITSSRGLTSSRKLRQNVLYH